MVDAAVADVKAEQRAVFDAEKSRKRAQEPIKGTGERYRYTGKVGRTFDTLAARAARAYVGKVCEVMIRGNNRDQGAVIRFSDGFTVWASWDELEAIA
jgi:hypothetical protein